MLIDCCGEVVFEIFCFVFCFCIVIDCYNVYVRMCKEIGKLSEGEGELWGRRGCCDVEIGSVVVLCCFFVCFVIVVVFICF